MTKKRPFFVAFALLFLFMGCNDDGQKKVIVDFSGPALDSTTISFHQDEAIHVAIASMTSPKETFIYYNDLLQHISSIIGMPVHYLQKESYEEVNQLLEQGTVDFAFICSGAYIDAKEKNSVDLLVGPVVDGQNAYTGYLICRKEIPAYSIRDLKGMSFAFSDPLSHTGYNIPLKLLKQNGLDPKSFFQKTLFTYRHDLSIEMVNRGIIDAAGVNSLIFNYLKNYSPEMIENVKIIEESEAFGIPPVVTPKGLDPKRYKLYKSIFLNLHKDPVGRRILDKINIDYYTELRDEMYDGVRKMKAESR